MVAPGEGEPVEAVRAQPNPEDSNNGTPIAGLPTGAEVLVVSPVDLERLRRAAKAASDSATGVASRVEIFADPSVREGLILVHDRDGKLFAELDTGGSRALPAIRYVARAG